MKKEFIMRFLFIPFLFIGLFALAEEDNSWMNGTWLSTTECIKISGSSISKTVDGDIIWEGSFYVDDDYELIIDSDSPHGRLKINPSLKVVEWYISSNPLIKLEDYTLPQEYNFLLGKWTDGSTIIEFSREKMLERNGKGELIKEGYYYIDDGNLYPIWDSPTESYDNYVVGTNFLAYEGGDSLAKLPDSIDTEASNENLINAFSKNQRAYDGEIKWAYGEWHLPSNDSRPRILLTPKYYQAVGPLDEYLENEDFKDLPKEEYSVVEEDNRYLGTVVRVGDFYLDTIEKRVYCVNGLDNKQYLTKTAKYVSPIIKYGKWVLLGLIAIAVAAFLVILLVNLLRKAVRGFKTWAQKVKSRRANKIQAAKEKRAEIETRHEHNSIQRPNVRFDIKRPRLSKAHWCLIIGLYFLLFLSLIVGIIILIPTIVFFILRKMNKEKADSLVAFCKGKIAPITSRPRLKRSLVLLLFGLFVYFYIGFGIGIITILLAFIYFALSKFAVNTTEKIDKGLLLVDNGVRVLWAKTYVKVIVCCLLIAFPFINNAPTYSVASIATPTVEETLGINQAPEELRDSEIPTFRHPQDVLSFLSRHTFKSDESGIRLVIRNDGVYADGTLLTTIPHVVDFSTDEATIEAKSPFNHAHYEIWLVRNGNKYMLKVCSLPSYTYVENFYMVD